MSSELKIKISDVLGKYLSDTPMKQERAIALVDELANLLSAQYVVAADGLVCTCSFTSVGVLRRYDCPVHQSEITRRA